MAQAEGENQAGNASTTTPDVFISYASQDTAVANVILEALELQGISCWIAPRDVTPGTHYASEIVHAIDTVRAIVLVLSANSSSSPHVLREVERATSKRHPVVSLRIDQTSLPAEFQYFLNTSQWLDASEGGTGRMMPKLVAAVRAAIQPPVDRSLAPGTSRTAVAAAAPRSTSRTAILLVAFAGVAIVGFAVYRSWRGAHPAAIPPAPAESVAMLTPAPAVPAISEKSVAVLPFVDMSEKKDQEYFSDGLSEELIDMLTKIPELQVPARTSSFYFKGKQATIADIGKALGVAHVLEGSVRKAGNTVRITAQLIRVSNGYHLWSETYDRKLDDIFKIQDDISNAVVRALKTSLLGRGSASEPRKVNPEAYTFFLQAKSISNHWNTPSEMTEALDYIERSIHLDPTFAPAWALLSRARSAQAADNLLLGEKNWTEARIAGEKAIALAPNDDKGYCAMAKINWLHDFDFAAARTQIQRALELDEGCGLTWGGYVAVAMGDFDKGIELLKRGVKQDPLNSFGYLYLAADEIYAGKLSDAKTNIGKVRELNPTSPVNFLEGLIFLEERNPAAALEAFDHDAEPGDRMVGRAIALYALGRKSESDLALKSLEDGYAEKVPFGIASVHAYRSDVDQAFLWLDKAYIARDDGCAFVKVYPLLRNIRADPRFKAFLHKMNLSE